MRRGGGGESKRCVISYLNASFYKNYAELRRTAPGANIPTIIFYIIPINQEREREKERNTLFKFLGIYFLIENTSDVFLYI